MARQNIGIGSSANDGNGDTLRTAGTKINNTLVELYQFLGGGDSNNLSSQISLEDSAVVFEGGTADAHETRLAAREPTADRVGVLPDLSGVVVLEGATVKTTFAAAALPSTRLCIIPSSDLRSPRNSSTLPRP